MSENSAPDVQELRTPDEAAAALRVSKRTIYRIVKDGELSGYQVGRHQALRFSAADIVAYLDRHRVPARD
jgi:excisionase family DNA binding protein